MNRTIASILALAVCLAVTASARLCRTNDACSANAFCKKAMGNCGGTGRCVERPTRITLELIPVCGCDGLVYGNKGEAWASGTSIKRRVRRVARPSRLGGPCARKRSTNDEPMAP